MVAVVYFKAAQSRKYLRVTDLYPAVPAPKTSCLLEQDDIFSVAIETFDENTGLVKVEASSDGKKFSTHDERMPVVHGDTYPIDDSSLAAPKKAPSATA